MENFNYYKRAEQVIDDLIGQTAVGELVKVTKQGTTEIKDMGSSFPCVGIKTLATDPNDGNLLATGCCVIFSKGERKAAIKIAEEIASVLENTIVMATHRNVNWSYHHNGIQSGGTKELEGEVDNLFTVMIILKWTVTFNPGTGMSGMNYPGQGGVWTPPVGKDGKSAYQIAVDEGFEGVVSQWLASLKGPKGDQGEPGEDGLPGMPGINGLNGQDGQPGVAGEKGEKGDQGERGLTGADGPQGESGINPDGLTNEIVIIDKMGTQHSFSFENGCLTNYAVESLPSLIIIIADLAAFATDIGVPSASQNYIVQSMNLTSDMLVTAPDGFEISLDNITFTGSVVVVKNIADVIYIRMTGAIGGTYVAGVIHESTGADSMTLTVGGTVTIPIPATPVAIAATNVLDSGFTAVWNAAARADSYRLDVASDAAFTNILTGYNDLTVAGTSQAVTGLTMLSTYYYRVRAVNGGGTTENSNSFGQEVLNVAVHTWVGKDGSDSTGAGTYANPYLTIAKVETLTLSGTYAVVLVKPGTYKAAAYHTFSKGYSYIAYGEVILQGTNNSRLVYFVTDNTASYIKGFILDDENNTGNLYGVMINAANKSLIDCKFRNFNRMMCVLPYLSANNVTLDNPEFEASCVNPYAITASYAITNGITINNPIFNGIHTAATLYFVNATTGYTVTVNNPTFNHKAVIGLYFNVVGGTLAVNGGNVTYKNSVTAKPFLYALAGTIKFNGTYFDLGTYLWATGANENGNLLYLNGTTASIPYFEFLDNVVSGTAAQTKALLIAKDCLSYKTNNNDITFANAPAIGSIINIFNPTKNTTGVVECDDNKIRSNNKSGYIILIGTDDTSTGNNRLIGVKCNRNKIWGTRYYNPSENNSTHSIMIGYCLDFEAKHNTLIGCGVGIVIEHDNAANRIMTSGGVWGNSFIDCYIPYAFGGVHNLKSYNNAIINRIAQAYALVMYKWNNTMAGVVWDDNNPTPITGAEFKNNIVVTTNANGQTLISVSEHCSFAANGCDNNLLYTNEPNTAFNYQDAIKTMAQWQALGFDMNSLLQELPELADIASAMQLVDLRPVAGSNVIGIGQDLGTNYDDMIDVISEDEIVTKDQPSGEPWTVGAWIR